MIGTRNLFYGALAAAAVAATLACTAPIPTQAEEEDAAMLKDLTDIDELKAAFNADKGSPRLLLLLSPT